MAQITEDEILDKLGIALANMSRENKKLEEENEQLEKQIEESKALNQRLKEELIIVDGKAEHFKNLYLKNEGNLEQIDAVQDEIDDANDKFQKMEQMIKIVAQKISQEKKKKEQIVQAYSQKSDTIQRLSLLVKKHLPSKKDEKYFAKITEYRDKIKTKREEEIKALKEKLTVLESDVKEKTENIKNLDIQIQHRQSVVDQLSDQIYHEESRIQKLSDADAEAREYKEDLLKKYEVLKEEKLTSDRNLESLQAKLHAQKKKYEKMKAKVLEQKENNKIHINQIKKVEYALKLKKQQHLDNIKDEKKNFINGLKSTIEAKKESIDAIINEIKEIEDESDNKEKKLENIRNEIKKEIDQHNLAKAGLEARLKKKKHILKCLIDANE